MKFIFLVLLVFVTLRSYSQVDNKMVDQVIAVVGTKAIFLSDLENLYLQYTQQSLESGKDLRCKLLEQLLHQKLLINQAEIDSVMVTEKEVDAELKQRFEYMTQQVGGEKKLEEYFKRSIPQIKAELREDLKERLTSQAMSAKITKEVKVTPSDVQRYFKTLPSDSIPLIEAQVELLQVVKAPVISAELKAQAKKQLEDLRDQIISSKEPVKKFAALARAYSEDLGSARNGGELGFMVKSDLVPEFANTAFALQPNEISKVIETEFGFHIIMLKERKGEQINVRHILISPKYEADAVDKSRLFLDSLSMLIRKDSIKFDKAATRYSDDDRTKNNGGLMTSRENESKISLESLDKSTLLVVKKLKIGEISEPFEATNERGKKVYKIIMLKNSIPAHRANLKDDYNKIMDKALKNKRKMEEDEWLEDKQKTTFIRVEPEYRDCNFTSKGWIK